MVKIAAPTINPITITVTITQYTTLSPLTILYRNCFNFFFLKISSALWKELKRESAAAPPGPSSAPPFPHNIILRLFIHTLLSCSY